ncbi:MAG TPA: CoA transferase [Ilumatobacteraceae bacterium]|nr:CoA transferase [Ilumatobacteraceae bacterium]
MEQGHLDSLTEMGGRVGFVVETVVVGNDPVLPTPWRVGEIAAVALARVGASAARLAQRAGGDPGAVRADVASAAAATAGFAVMRVDGARMERTNAANPWVERYRCADGRWIHVHGGFPALADRLADLLHLPVEADASAIAAAVGGWISSELEDAVAARRGCAAIIRTADEWSDHPQGRLVGQWPTVVERDGGGPAATRWEPSPRRPLEGLRVLDLTRVLAGPTCGRALAAFGADVLHVRGPDVPYVPAFVIDTGHGKRQAHADLRDPEQLERLRAVARDADVIVQGYRPGVVARFGLDETSLRSDGFTGLYGSVSAFGHDGPWSDRAGWEQLAQSTSGLCLDPLGDERPVMLPSAATDYTTGFALAAGLMEALDATLTDGRARRVDASLCQTAAWILRAGRVAVGASPSGLAPTLMRTESPFGVVEHLGPCVAVDGLDVGWTRPTTPLGQGTLGW